MMYHQSRDLMQSNHPVGANGLTLPSDFNELVMSNVTQKVMAANSDGAPGRRHGSCSMPGDRPTLPVAAKRHAACLPDNAWEATQELGLNTNEISTGRNRKKGFCRQTLR